MSDLARLEQQVTFLREMDRLKSVIRQTQLLSADRRENTAEHSWHIAMGALTLAEYAPDGTDIARAVKLLLIHDIIEIDAGDTYAYDVEGHIDKYEREAAAARRIFGLLPDEQRDIYIALWEEFEHIETTDAKFANAIDQLLPTLYNTWNDGGSWSERNPTYEQVFARSQRRLGDSGADAIWDYVQKLIADAVAKGWLAPPTTDNAQ